MSGILEFVHVASAAAWVGGAMITYAMYMIAMNMTDLVAVRKLNDINEGLGKVYYGPFSLLTLLAGIGVVLTNDSWSFADPFISVGFLVVFVSMGIGGALISPAARKHSAAIDAAGATSTPEIEALGKKVQMFATLNILVLLFAVYAMVTKL